MASNPSPVARDVPLNGKMVRLALGYTRPVSDRELNERLAATVGRSGYNAPAGLDEALFKQACRRPDMENDQLNGLLVDLVIGMQRADGARLLESPAKGEQMAAEVRRRCGVPDALFKSLNN